MSHCVSSGIADYRCYTPNSFLNKMAYRSPKTDLTGGVSQKKLASEAYRAIGASHKKQHRQSHYSSKAKFIKVCLGKPQTSWKLPQNLTHVEPMQTSRTLKTLSAPIKEITAFLLHEIVRATGQV